MDTGIVLSLVAVLIAGIGALMNGRKDTRGEAAALASMQTKLDTINNGVTDIRVEIRTMRDTVGQHSERLAKVEERALSNTRRLDAIDGRKDGNND